MGQMGGDSIGPVKRRQREFGVSLRLDGPRDGHSSAFAERRHTTPLPRIIEQRRCYCSSSFWRGAPKLRSV